MVDDEELHRRLELLRQRLANGKIIIAEHLAAEFERSFHRVKYAPDGSVDLTTVDSRVRSMAMMAAMMDDREQLKSAASLIAIQEAYYSRVSAMFSVAYELMKKRHGNPQSISWALSRDDQHVEQNHPLIDPFVKELGEFWEAVSETLRYHIQDLNALKGVFGGDLFPSYDHNIASSTGLYLDTIVLTDPFMNTRDLFRKWPKQEAVRMFLKHGLQVLNYRDLVLANTDQPIVVILPFESSYDENYRKSLFEAAGVRALQHAERVFGRSFEDLAELQGFLSNLDDAQGAAEIVRDPSRLLFDVEWQGDVNTQISRAIEEFQSLTGSHAGRVIFNQCLGRMSQATDISWKSMSLGGTPLIDAPTSWEYYNWMLEYSAAKDSQSDLPLHISRGMQRLARTDMQWLGNVPTAALIEIRKQGALDEIRAILSNGVDEVIALNQNNFFRSADKIYDNLEKAFVDHKKRVDELRAKKWKFAGSDIGSWVVAGSVEVAAAIFGTPTLGLASVAISQLTDAPKLRDLPKLGMALREERKLLSNSASGLLFKHRK